MVCATAWQRSGLADEGPVQGVLPGGVTFYNCHPMIAAPYRTVVERR
jgi:hypothetical protein